MLTLSYGFKKPEVPDQGAIVFPALEDNWQQVNDHNHDGINSALIAGLSLPPQPGNAGRFLQTNGVSASWQPVEVITASNVGGAIGIFKQKAVSDLEFKSIEAGTNITLDTTDPDKIIVNATGGGGGVITVAGMRAELVRNDTSSVTLISIAANIYEFPLVDVVGTDPNGLIVGPAEFRVPLSYVGTANCRITWSAFQQEPGIHYWLVRKNGATFKYGQAMSVASVPVNCCVEFTAVAGDVFKIVDESATVPRLDGGAAFHWAVFTIEPK